MSWELFLSIPWTLRKPASVSTVLSFRAVGVSLLRESYTYVPLLAISTRRHDIECLASTMAVPSSSSPRHYDHLLRDITDACAATQSYMDLAHSVAATLLQSIKRDMRNDELIFKNNSQLMMSLDSVSDINKNIVVVKEQLLLGVLGEAIKKKYYKDYNVEYNPQLLIEPYLLSANQRELLSSLKQFVDMYVEGEIKQSKTKHLDNNKILGIVTYFLDNGRRQLVREHILSEGNYNNSGTNADNSSADESSSASVRDICNALMESVKIPKQKTFIVNNCSYSSNNYDSTVADLAAPPPARESIDYEGLQAMSSRLTGRLLPQFLRTKIFHSVLVAETKFHEKNSHLGSFSTNTSSSVPKTVAVSEYELSRVHVSTFISTVVAKAMEESFPIATFHINRSIYNKVNTITHAIDIENPNNAPKDDINFVAQHYQNNHLLIKNKQQLKLLVKKTELIVEALFSLNGNISDRLVKIALLLVHVFEDEMHFLSSEMIAIHTYVTLNLLPSKTYHRSYSVINLSIKSFRLLSDLDPEVIVCLKSMHLRESASRNDASTVTNGNQSSSAGMNEGAVALFLFEDWLESCFLGCMSEYCVLYIWYFLS